MNSVLDISAAANLALHAMTVMAGEPARVFSVRELAEGLGVSAHHLMKVLQRLQRARLVVSRRGPRGGFLLGAEAMGVSLLAIYEAIDGKLAPRACLFGERRCAGACVFGDFIVATNRAFRERLEGTTLAVAVAATRRGHVGKA